MTRPVIIDTDGVVDDAVALWWAVTHPSLDVVAITVVWGNIDIPEATTSVVAVLEAAGRLDIPVATGEPAAFEPAPTLRRATFVHGEDGLGNTSPQRPDVAVASDDAAAYIADLVRRRPGEISVVTIGPLTNVAAALRSDAEFAQNLHSLVMMAGTAGTIGNAMPLGEGHKASGTTNQAGSPHRARGVASHPVSDRGRTPVLPTRARWGEHSTSAADPHASALGSK